MSGSYKGRLKMDDFLSWFKSSYIYSNIEDSNIYDTNNVSYNDFLQQTFYYCNINLTQLCLTEQGILLLFQKDIYDYFKLKLSEYGLKCKYNNIISKSNFTKNYITIAKDTDKFEKENNLFRNDYMMVSKFFQSKNVKEVFEWQIPYYKFWIKKFYSEKTSNYTFEDETLDKFNNFILEIIENIKKNSESELFINLNLFQLENDFSYNYFMVTIKKLREKNIVGKKLTLEAKQKMSDISLFKGLPKYDLRNKLIHFCSLKNESRENYIKYGVFLKYIIFPFIDYFIASLFFDMKNKEHLKNISYNKKIFDIKTNYYLNYRVSEEDKLIFEKLNKVIKDRSKHDKDLFQIEYSNYKNKESFYKNTHNNIYPSFKNKIDEIIKYYLYYS